MLILIVDDHELIRAGLKQALQAAGHNIVGEAASLAEARAELLFTQPDLVLVDVNLPDGSGLELITPLLRCIVLTVMIRHPCSKRIDAGLLPTFLRESRLRICLRLLSN